MAQWVFMGMVRWCAGTVDVEGVDGCRGCVGWYDVVGYVDVGGVRGRVVAAG